MAILQRPWWCLSCSFIHITTTWSFGTFIIMTPLLGCHPAHKTICLDHNHLNSPPACPEPLRDGLQKGKGICPVHLPASLNSDQLCSELFQSTAITRQRDPIVDLCVSVGGGDETESVSAITVAQDKLRSATCVNAEHLYRPDHEPKLYRGKSVSGRFNGHTFTFISSCAAQRRHQHHHPHHLHIITWGAMLARWPTIKSAPSNASSIFNLIVAAF